MTVSTEGELSRFREEWIREVQTRKSQASSSPAGAPVEQGLRPPSASVPNTQVVPAPAPAGVVVDRDDFQARKGSIPVASPALLSALVRSSIPTPEIGAQGPPYSKYIAKLWMQRREGP
jgi:hypothetical protein